MKSFALIVPAAGSGKRMQLDTPKPFLKIEGKSILRLTLDCFIDQPLLKEVVVPTSAEYLDSCQEILNDWKAYHKKEVSVFAILGGDERQHSISNAIETISAPYVAVHDAVRPFVGAELIQNTLEAAFTYKAAILAVPARDTVKKVSADLFIESTLDRSDLYLVQTPQIFETRLLKKAYKTAASEGWQVTDDASLLERMGNKVFVVKGSYANIKITFPEDLIVAKALLKNNL